MLRHIGHAGLRPGGRELSHGRAPRSRAPHEAGRARSQRACPARKPRCRSQLVPGRPPARLRHDEAVPPRRRSRPAPARTPPAARGGGRQPGAPSVDQAERRDGRRVRVGDRRRVPRLLLRARQESAGAGRRHRPSRTRPLPGERAPVGQRRAPRRLGAGNGPRAQARRALLGARRRKGQEHSHLGPRAGRRRPAGRRGRRDRNRRLRRLERRPPPAPAHESRPDRRSQRLGQVLERLGPGLPDRERR